MPASTGPVSVPCDLHPVLSAPTLGLCLPDLAARVRGRRVFLCTERRLARLLKGRLAGLARGLDGADVVVFEGGERNKNRRTKALLEDRLLRRGAGKDCLLVAVGGGMVTDLVGFTAATYLRGVPYVSVPTTLLAMVDAALGGKTGVNTPRGKNLVGAHHPPEAVYLAVDALATLPLREFAAGLAESLKHGLIEDRRLFRDLSGRTPAEVKGAPGDLESLVRTSAAIKCRVASEDPLEASGRRNVLNAGHTVAHALEALSGFRMGHGEAVAAGLCWEAAASVVQGFFNGRDLPAVLRAAGALGFSRRGLGADPADIHRAAGADKKNRQGAVVYVPLGGIGRVALAPPHVAPLTVEDLRAAAKLLEVP